MYIHPDMTIGEVVAHHYQTAEVFSRYGIDFCCGGKKTLAKACTEHEMPWETLSDALQRAIQAPALPSSNPDNWEPDFLAGFIEQTHHRYLRTHLPLLQEYLGKAARVHGERHPELKIIEKQVALLSADLLEHMEKEEKILFPYVRMLCEAQRQHAQPPRAPFQTVKNPIHVMEQEHDYAGSLLDNVRELSHQFLPPDDACATYRVAFAKLKELDEDLRWHVHLENNILFPKAILLEQLLSHQN